MADLLHRLVIDRVRECDGLDSAMDGLESASSTDRKIAFAILVYSLKCGLAPKDLSAAASRWSYSAESQLFFTYDKIRRAEVSYFKEKKVSQNIKKYENEKVLLYFAPIKYLEEGRVYRMTMQDLERIAYKKNWSSLPDPKACYCWMSVDSAFSHLILKESDTLLLPIARQFSERFPSEGYIKKEEVALTIFKRQNSYTKMLRTSVSRRQFSPQRKKPSLFQPSPMGNIKRASTFKFGPLHCSEVEVSKSGLSDEPMSFGESCSVNLSRARSDHKISNHQ